MTSRITFRLFLICLIACALLALGAVWLRDRITSPLYFQITATTFIIGLASFLIWFSCTLLSIRLLLKVPEVSDETA